MLTCNLHWYANMYRNFLWGSAASLFARMHLHNRAISLFFTSSFFPVPFSVLTLPVIFVFFFLLNVSIPHLNDLPWYTFRFSLDPKIPNSFLTMIRLGKWDGTPVFCNRSMLFPKKLHFAFQIAISYSVVWMMLCYDSNALDEIFHYLNIRLFPFFPFL